MSPRARTSPKPVPGRSSKSLPAGVRDRAGSPVRGRKRPVDLGQALIEAFLTNERVNQTLLDLLDPRRGRAGRSSRARGPSWA